MTTSGEVFAMRSVENGVVIEAVVENQLEELFMISVQEAEGIAEGSHIIVEYDIDFGWALAA